MGELQLIDKLTFELKKEITNELQIVYILSRIRKILETKKIKDKYPILNFYCNWSLHSEMTKTDGKAINNILKEFIEKPQERDRLGFHMKFLEQFKSFLKDNNLPQLSEKNLVNFRFQLQKIIADTPIEVKVGTKYKIEFKEPMNNLESGLHVTTIIDS